LFLLLGGFQFGEFVALGRLDHFVGLFSLGLLLIFLIKSLFFDTSFE